MPGASFVIINNALGKYFSYFSTNCSLKTLFLKTPFVCSKETSGSRLFLRSAPFLFAKSFLGQVIPRCGLVVDNLSRWTLSICRAESFIF